MDIIFFPFRLIYKLFFATFFALTIILYYPFFKFFLVKEKRFPSAFKLMRIYAKMWLFSTAVLLRVKGVENKITDGPYLICANHSSFLDIPCLYSIFENYFVFTGKKEFEKWPLFRVFYTSGMNILVDRHKKTGDLKAFKKMVSVIDAGLPLVIFPEGTISKNAPKLTSFKSGAISIAIQKQVPILPVTFTTNWKRLQRKGLFRGKASPGFSEVIVHPPIPTVGLTKRDGEELLHRLHKVIEQPLIEQY